MFFKKDKGETVVKSNVIKIEINLVKHLPDGNYVTEDLTWTFKNLNNFTQYKNDLQRFSANWENKFLEIEEDGDYTFFAVPTDFELYGSSCEIIEEEINA